MSPEEQWGIPGVIHIPQPQNPYQSSNARALADAYIHNTRNQYEAQYANVPQRYSYEGGDPIIPNTVVKPSVNDQVRQAIDYLNAPYTPTDPNNPQQVRYAGTPRYQQWVDGVTMSPRDVALGNSSSYPADIRAMSIYSHK